MGTNFYVQIPASLEDKDPVLCNAFVFAKEAEEESESERRWPGTWLHLGKSSGGWCFGLHVIPELNIRTLGDWKVLFDQIGIRDVEIRDEYGELHTVSAFLEVVTNRAWQKDPASRDYTKDPWYKSLEDLLERNHAVLGPNNLLRSKVDGSHCVGHGDGTWDLIAGEFS